MSNGNKRNYSSQQEVEEEEEAEAGGGDLGKEDKKTSSSITVASKKSKAKREKKSKYPEVDTTPNTAFFENFSIAFEKESIKNYYFVVKVRGEKDFRFYKAKMNAVLTALQQALFACDEFGKNLDTDAEIYEKVVDQDKDGDFMSKILASVYGGKLGIFLRVFVYSPEQDKFLPSTRAIRFQHCHKEFGRLSDFVDRKLMYVNQKKKF